MTGLPGIIIQFLMIPPILLLFGHGHKRSEQNAVRSAMNLIAQDTASCVIIKGNTIVRTEYGRGIGPMIKLYEEGVLEGAFVVDKIVGKASAMILTLGGVKSCYGLIMSKGAYQWLSEHAVRVECDTLVDAIINRKGDGLCPMELTVQDIENEQEALAAVKRKMEELRKAEKERQEVL